ncbi:ATP synthase F0 subunit B [Paracoccus pacificus]|uniref:ATP synthase F0 subunit B n=1 Tax=Paracoccus pacificus TaxID=1463598 RepID=A0ABW4R4H4_9RHOB
MSDTEVLLADTQGVDATPRRVMDWPAIFAGAAIAAGVTVVLTGFTTALGLGSISAEPGEQGGGFMGVLVALFAFLGMLLAYALGGYVAGRMRTRAAGVSSDETMARDGTHGLTVWAVGTLLATLLTVMIATGGLRTVGNAAASLAEAGGSAVGGALQGTGQVVGGVVSGAGQVAGGAISGAGQAIGGLAQGAGQAAGGGGLQDMLPGGMQANPIDYLADQLLRPQPGATTNFSNEAIRRELGNILGNVIRTGELSEADRTYLVQALAARTELSEQEINQRLDQTVQSITAIRDDAQQRLDQARTQAEELAAQAKAEAERLQAEAQARLEEAKQTAIDATEAARKAAIWTALLLAISSIVAAGVAFAAAVKGGQDRDSGRFWLRRS